MSVTRTYLLGDTCSACSGNGRTPSRSEHWRTGWDEDGHYRTQEHETLAEALAWRAKYDSPLVGSVDVIAPDGRMYQTDAAIEGLARERTPAPLRRAP